jgi:hypothetical protein
MATLTATQTVQELISYNIVKDKNSLVRLLERNGVQMPNNPSNNEVTVAVLLANQKSPSFRKDLGSLLSNNFSNAQDDFKSFTATEEDYGFNGLNMGELSGIKSGVRPIGVMGDSTSDNWGFTGIDDFYLNPPKNYKVGNGTAFTAFTGDGEGFYNENLPPTKAKQKRISLENPKGKSKVGLALGTIANTLFTQENINSGIQLGLGALANKQASKQNALQENATVLAAQQDEIDKKMKDPKNKKSNTTTYILIGVGVVALLGVVYAITQSGKSKSAK